MLNIQQIGGVLKYFSTIIIVKDIFYAKGSYYEFKCFYYPTITKDDVLLRCDKDIVEFDFGDKVQTKIIYYNFSRK